MQLKYLKEITQHSAARFLSQMQIFAAPSDEALTTSEARDSLLRGISREGLVGEQSLSVASTESDGVATVFGLLVVATGILLIVVLLTSLTTEDQYPKAIDLTEAPAPRQRAVPPASNAVPFTAPFASPPVTAATGSQFAPPMIQPAQAQPVYVQDPPLFMQEPVRERELTLTPAQPQYMPEAQKFAPPLFMQEPQKPFVQEPQKAAPPPFMVEPQRPAPAPIVVQEPEAAPASSWPFMTPQDQQFMTPQAQQPQIPVMQRQNSRGAMLIPERPNPSAMLFPDPRVQLPSDLPQGATRRDVGVIGFCRAGPAESWDQICGSGFLSNAWDMGQDGLVIATKGSQATRPFTNAEAAYQALALWDRAESFRPLGALQAQQLARELAGRQDATFGGHGGSWQAMLSVLRAKFFPGSPCAEALRQTGDAFLLEHDGEQRLDRVYSGDGTNWLGLQLMILRDELKEIGSPKGLSSGNLGPTWTDFARETCMIDLRTGAQHPSGGDAWQGAVRSATSVLLLRLILQPSAEGGGSTGAEPWRTLSSDEAAAEGWTLPGRAA